MKTKLWEKENKTDSLIERFTIGKDQSLDLLIAPFDVIASKAHAKMLAKVELISHDECSQLLQGLNEIEILLQKGEFHIEEGVEDVHSQIEFYLTKKYGDIGKKIHTARSRNDQVLTAIKLYLKQELENVSSKTKELIGLFYELSKTEAVLACAWQKKFLVHAAAGCLLWPILQCLLHRLYDACKKAIQV